MPGSIFSAQSAGCNKKIKELQAIITLSPDDVVESLGRTVKRQSQTAVQLDMDLQSIINLLNDGGLHFDEILQKVDIDIATLSSALSQLEILGMIRKLQGNYYEIIPRI